MNFPVKLLRTATLKPINIARPISLCAKPLNQRVHGKEVRRGPLTGVDFDALPEVPINYRFIYPEFLPDPTFEFRNQMREKLERLDMLDRRRKIVLPEFYVGSVLRVTSTDPHSTGKVAKFVGICIMRHRCGLRHAFVLRNVIDNQGMEIRYNLYDPTLQKIEVLRLEKRLDDQLLYLRDALPEYSTFPEDMEAEFLKEGEPVPVNPVKVVLRPRPWFARWEREGLLGVANIDEHTNERRRLKAKEQEKPWEKFDIMKQYRRTIPEEEQKLIFSEVAPQLKELEVQHKRGQRRRTNIKSKLFDINF